MMATGVNFDYWKHVALIQIWEAATMIHGYDPRARQFGYSPMTSEGDALDMSADHRMLASAVMANELESAGDAAGEVGPETYLKRASLADWARSHGFATMADGLDSQASSNGPPPINPGSVASSPKFSMTRAALVAQHRHEWPTIDADIKDASKNGLTTAKVGKRGWDEDLAVEWARSKGKLNKPAVAGARLSSAMANLPVTTHRMKR